MNAALVLALQNGFLCNARKFPPPIAGSIQTTLTRIAVARTPQRLIDMLLGKDVSQATIDAQLHITKGDVRDVNAVKTTLARDGLPVQAVLSGIGMLPTWSNWDPTVCQDSARTIIAALDTLKVPAGTQRPFLVVISTTGITSGPRDVPLAFTLLYHAVLAVPHRGMFPLSQFHPQPHFRSSELMRVPPAKDKRAMEELIVVADKEGNKISGFCFVRPSLLIDWSNPGTVRVGTEEAPAVGYSITRADVGRWIFEECIKGDPYRWNGKKTSLTC